MFTVLQLTSLTFLVPAGVAGANGIIDLCVLCTLNAIISFFVHSKSASPPWLHRLDNAAVALWVGFNGGYTFGLCCPLRGLVAMLLAVSCAACGLARLQWSPKSANRLWIHGAMHCSGALGTLVLIA